MKVKPLWIAALVVVIVIAVLAAYFIYLRPLQQPRKVLRVGTSPDFPPFEYIDEATGEVVGIDIDLVKLIAKKLGYEVEIVSMSFEGLIPALQAGQIDLIASGMTITEERAKVVDFSIPYWNADQAILVIKDSEFRPRGLDDLVGRKVGVQTGTTAESLVDNYIRKKGVSIDLKSYDSYILAVQDLVSGRIDAVVVDTPVAQALAKRYSVEISAVIETGERYGLAVRKGNTDLLNGINKALQEILSSPEWSEIIAKYIG